MLTEQLKQAAAERGAEWGRREADLAAERVANGGQWGEWMWWQYNGDLPHDTVRDRTDEQEADREQYEDILDRAAKAAYEAARDGGGA